MGITVSMLMITAGAIMRYAVSAQGNGFNVHTVGIILLIVGIVGAVLSIAFWTRFGGFGHRPATVVGDHDTVVRERQVL
jgi:hypothetical protein